MTPWRAALPAAGHLGTSDSGDQDSGGATGVWSSRQLVSHCSGTGMTVAVFRQAGTVERNKEVLNMLVKAFARWCAIF